ncbi:MAG: glycosyltransferase N-terminal domain-containing protein [Gemmatimonadaceae bacterium]
MRSLPQLAYECAAQLARAAAAIAPAGDAKTIRALRARRGIRDRYRAWGATAARDATRPLLWMHAPSVGEGLQARPVLQSIRAARPRTQLAYTFYSPSAESFARTLDVDFRDYLPFDDAGDARQALDSLRPAALVFSKLDVWPTLAREATTRGVALGLLSATLAASSGRRSWIAAALLRDAYAALDAIGAISGDDAERLVALGARAGAVTVTGDTRYDQVWERAAASDRASALLAPLASGRPTLVAGSTWPADERVLFAAWTTARRTAGDARLIVAPHEPTARHVDRIIEWARGAALRVARLGDANATADVIVVDRVGVLGDLYALADVAYVGGGFHDAGLHSVLEPAAFGAPVLVGPRHDASRDAGLLIAARGARSESSVAGLAGVIGTWLGDTAARREAGDAARETVRAGRGATARSVSIVETLLDR